MNTILAIALVVTNTGWAFAYRRLVIRHVETVGALWAQMLGK